MNVQLYKKNLMLVSLNIQSTKEEREANSLFKYSVQGSFGEIFRSMAESQARCIVRRVIRDDRGGSSH